MKMLTFAKRTLKEILRDPITLLFGLGFPGILILLLSAIQANIPVSLFEIDRLAPGMTVFGLAFISLSSVASSSNSEKELSIIAVSSSKAASSRAVLSIAEK